MGFRTSVSRTALVAPNRSAVKSSVLLVLVAIAVSAGLLLVLGPYQVDKVLGIQLVLILAAILFFVLLHWPQVGTALMIVGGLLVVAPEHEDGDAQDRKHVSHGNLPVVRRLAVTR